MKKIPGGKPPKPDPLWTPPIPKDPVLEAIEKYQPILTTIIENWTFIHERDKFAEVALGAILKRADASANVDDLVQRAWYIADSMMLARKGAKRG